MGRGNLFCTCTFLYLHLTFITEMWNTSNIYIVALATAAAISMIIPLSFNTIDAQSSEGSQNVTSTILKNAGEDFSQAIEALNSNNITGAVNEARSGMFYLEMLGIPNNCLIDDNEMLQCGFPR
jgi:tRNA(Leu) C34 or U34 (ribose-2'-O)-methylase TrmL